MKSNRYYLVLLLTAALTAACGKAPVPADEPGSVRLRSFLGTRAGDPAEEDSRSEHPLFLFWTENNFNNASAAAEDFFVRDPEEAVNAFSETPYNTMVPYPSGNRMVYATGFAPSPGQGGLSFVTANDYSLFNIPASPLAGTSGSEYGAVDVLAAREPVFGNQMGPISAPLMFEHAQVKLTFDAKLAPTMTKFVKFIRIEFPGDLTPVTLAWNATSQKYEVRGRAAAQKSVFGLFWTEDGTYLSSSPRANNTMSFQLSSSKTQSVGYTHIVPPAAASIPVTVHYEMADRVGDFGTTLEETAALPYVHHEAVDLTLTFPTRPVAGDAYQFTLVFDSLVIDVSGSPVPWEEGVYVPLPYPFHLEP